MRVTPQLLATLKLISPFADEEEFYAYELSQLPANSRRQLSVQTIGRWLKRLQREGWLSYRPEGSAELRASGELGRPARQYYRWTDLGRQEYLALLHKKG